MQKSLTTAIFDALYYLYGTFLHQFYYIYLYLDIYSIYLTASIYLRSFTKVFINFPISPLFAQ